MLRRLLVFMGMIVAVVLSFKYCEFKKGDDSAIDYNTLIQQQQIVNVGKLVVTEGHLKWSPIRIRRVSNGYGFI
jgi:hypothetical protein